MPRREGRAENTAGTLVDLWPCNGGLNQQWIIVFDFGVKIVSALHLANGSPLCLDSSGGPSVGGGTQLVINACSSAASRNWIVRRMQFELSSNAPYMCANVQGSDTANGTPLIAYSCDDAPNELWNFENGEILGLGTQSGTSKCLSAGGTGGIGSPVELSTCDGIYQGWELVNGASYGLPPALPASGLLLNTTNALCGDSAGGPVIGGTPNS